MTHVPKTLFVGRVTSYVDLALGQFVERRGSDPPLNHNMKGAVVSAPPPTIEARRGTREGGVPPGEEVAALLQLREGGAHHHVLALVRQHRVAVHHQRQRYVRAQQRFGPRPPPAAAPAHGGKPPGMGWPQSQKGTKEGCAPTAAAASPLGFPNRTRLAVATESLLREWLRPVLIPCR